MDEKVMRAYFERAARTNLPPSTVDVARARKAGRRRLRIRRAGFPAASSAAVLAVGALFAGGVLPTGPTSRPAVTGHGHHAHKPARATGPMAPTSFDPLAIYATFGWLPPGFSVTSPDDGQFATQSYAAASGPNNQSIALSVFAAHVCTVTGPIWYPPKYTYRRPIGLHQHYLPRRRYPHGLACNTGAPPDPSPILPAGHLADGRPAYVTLNYYGPTALAWQYARDGWATLQWEWVLPRPPQIKKIAARVRYGSNLLLPFPFKLEGIPASWKVAGADDQMLEGRLTGYQLFLGPRQKPEGVQILVLLPQPYGCGNIGGTTKNVTFDGVAGVTRDRGTEACFAHLGGMFVFVVSNQQGGALGFLRHMHVLGTDPANWTTQPIGWSR